MSNLQKPKRIDLVEGVRLSMFVAGLSLVAYGAWLVHQPAGFIVAGLMLFACSILSAYRGGK